MSVREKALRVIEQDLEDPDPGVRRKAVQLLSYFESKQTTPEWRPEPVGQAGPRGTNLGDLLEFARRNVLGFGREAPSSVTDVPGVPEPTEFSEPASSSPRRVKFDGRWMSVELAARERREHEGWRRRVEWANANERADWDVP